MNDKWYFRQCDAVIMFGRLVLYLAKSVAFIFVSQSKKQICVRNTDMQNN